MSNADHPSSDVTIVGAGIVGICCALSILETGKTVRLIDRAAPGQATSFGNAGVISPWSIIPQSVPGLWKKIPGMLLRENGPISVRVRHLPKLIPWGLRFLRNGTAEQVAAAATAMDTLNHANVDLYRKHLAGTGHEALVQDSWYVHAFRDPRKASTADLGYRIRAEHGAELERIGADELHALEPALSREFKAAVLIKGQARAVSPGKIGEVLSQKAMALGATLHRADVTALTHNADGTWSVHTDTGTVCAPQVVVAAGAWSVDLLRPLGLDVPLQAERGYHVEFPTAGIEVNNSIMDTDMMAVASAMETGVRVAGTAEFTDRDAPRNEKRVRELATIAKRLFPDLDTDGMTSWMGSRPSFPDSLPMLGEFPDRPGLYSAFGHSHYGLMMAPKTGQILADLVNNTAPNTDLSPFSVTRFEA
ncbi:MAG: FAD-binding oxidoreductase [Pseudomonadota bacterium]